MPFKFLTDWFTSTPTPTSAPPGWGPGHYGYSQGPSSQRMFGGSSIHGSGSRGMAPGGDRTLGSFLPPRRDRYISYQQPSILDAIKDYRKRTDFANLDVDYTPQKPALGPNLSSGGSLGGRPRGYRQVPYYQPPMPMRMDVAALLQLIQQAQKSRGNAIRRFNINPIV
jgi:hypothetical protein